MSLPANTMIGTISCVITRFNRVSKIRKPPGWPKIQPRGPQIFDPPDSMVSRDGDRRGVRFANGRGTLERIHRVVISMAVEKTAGVIHENRRRTGSNLCKRPRESGLPEYGVSGCVLLMRPCQRDTGFAGRRVGLSLPVQIIDARSKYRSFQDDKRPRCLKQTLRRVLVVKTRIAPVTVRILPAYQSLRKTVARRCTTIS